MRFFILSAACLFLILHSPISAFAEDPDSIPSLPQVNRPKTQESINSDGQPWFRNVGEWMSKRSTREGVMTDDNSKIITDGKRFDISIGKRIPLLVWGEESRSEGWALGVDGGMLASLRRYKVNGKLNFATNTFDGYFGAFLGYTNSGWLVMARTAHLSAHLVDDASTFYQPVGYSHFWNELILGKDFIEPETVSAWDAYIQGSIGMNNTSTPASSNPRFELGFSAGYAFDGPDTLAIMMSIDALNAGVQNQKTSYSEFLGFGYLTRPNNTHRPFRIGVSHFHGSDFRNQLFANAQNYTALEVQLDF